MLGYLAYAMYRVSFGVILPGVEEAYQISDVEAGLAVSLGSLTITVFILYGGHLADRLGVSTSLLLGVSILSGSLLGFGFAGGFPLFLLLLSTAGVGGGIVVPAVYTWIGEASPGRRGLGLGVTNAFFGFGGFLGSWLAGFLLKEGYPWFLPLQIFGLTGFLSLGIVFKKLGKPSLARKYREKPDSTLGYLKMLKRRPLLILFFSMLLSNLAYFSFITWIPSFLLRVQGFSLAESGLALAFFSAVGSLGAIFFGWVHDKSRSRLMPAMLGLTSTMVLTLIVWCRYSPLAGFLLFPAFGFLLFPYWNLQITLAQEAVDKYSRGKATGLVQSSGLLASILAPTITAALIEQTTMPLALTASSLIPLLAYSLLIATWKAEKPAVKM